MSVTKNIDFELPLIPSPDEVQAKTPEEQKKESIERAKKLLEKLPPTNKVPLEVFPIEIQDFILSYHDYYKLPLDYYFASVLTAAGVVIGNSFSVEYLPNWEGVGMMWMILVGTSSQGKSPVMKHCLMPLREIQDDYVKEFESDLKKWKLENVGKKSRDIDEENRPYAYRLITSKATTEKMIELLEKNPRGILMSRPEITGWMKSMNQYSNGDDQENYMEWWDNDTWSDDKKSTGFAYLKNPFLSILSGIQKKIVQKMGSGENAATGFFQRFLFAIPDTEIIPLPVEGCPDSFIYDQYKKVIENLNKLSHINSESRVKIPMDEKASKAYFNYRCLSVEKRNDTDDDVIKSMLGKLETYVLRFAIIIELLKFVTEYKGKSLTSMVYEHGYRVSEDSILKAIKIANYFEANGRNVTDRISSPVMVLSEGQQIWYNALPEFEFFKSKTALDIAISLSQEKGVRGISKRSIKRLLGRKDLFERERSGIYMRKY